MSSNILVLGAVGLIFVLVLFGFLLGFLRGFRKSMYFTIIFIVVVILSFIFATVLAKSVYSGSTLWKVAKSVIPSKIKEGSESVTSLKEFVRFYLTHNYTEVLESGMTAGESIVANENAMGIIDGLIVMILKVAMLIGCYLVLTILFYIVFGLIYLLFLRPKTYIETTTTTDEDGKETVEEKEVKPNKKRLSGGFVGAAKGFIKAMIILIPISFAIGMIAQIEIPTRSTVNAEVRYESSSSTTKTLEDIVAACKKYDKSIGKIHLGLDDFVMDKIISYDVKDANGKKVKVVLRKEISGFINIYNTIEKEIGVENLDDYDFKNNINSTEMKNIVSSLTENLSNSNAITTLLTAVGDEGSVILEDKLSEKDSDLALLFDEVNLKNKDSKWWSEQIEQLNDIYKSFADMNLDFSKVDSKEYNLMFKETTKESYEKFIDEIFNNELLEMFIGGGLKYTVKKLPADMQEIESTTNQVVDDKEVDKELKAFSGFINVLRDDIVFKDGSVDTDELNVKTLNDIVDTEVLINSKIVGKLTTILIKNAISEVAFDGEDIGFDTSIFDSASFVIHNEVSSLAKVLTDGFTAECKLSKLKNFSDEANVGEVCKMLESNGLDNSLICNELFGKIMPKVLHTVAPDEDFSSLVWKDEFKAISGTLESLYERDTLVNNLSNLDFDTMTYKKLDNLSNNAKVWQGKVITKLLNGLALPFIDTIDVDGNPIELEYDKDKIVWKNEIKGIVNIGVWASDTDGVITDSDYDNTVGSLTNAFSDTLKVKVLNVLGEEVQDDKHNELLHALANGMLKELLGSDVGDSKFECPALSNIANILDDNTSDSYMGYGNIVISEIESKATNALPEAQFKTLTNTLSNNIANSKYLQKVIDSNLATSVDKSSWDGVKWESEMKAIDNVAQEMDPDTSGNIAMSTISTSMEEVKDSMLVELEENTPNSEILQDVFSDTLVSNSLISNKSDITDWDLEMSGLITVARTMEDSNNKIKLSELNTITTIRVRTIESLKTNTYKSVVLKNTMTNNLSEPMSTPSMSIWSDLKWEREMPRICEVLKTLANDPTDYDEAILIDDVNMGEDSEIKRITFQRIEDNIAYSEALQNMFKEAMSSVEDSENPYTFPNEPSISGDLEDFSEWWYIEITGLANVIYAEMGIDDPKDNDIIKISEFSDTEGAKVKVVKALSEDAIYEYSDTEGYHEVLKKRVYSDIFSQQSNIGVSEYLQYMFKPQFRDLSKTTVSGDTKYYTFTDTYNWDYELELIMNVYLTTQMKYNDGALVELDDNDEVEFNDEVNFKLLDATQTTSGTGLEASLRNKAVLNAISLNISDNTYLQFVLASEMKRMMNGYVEGYEKYIAKDPTSISGNETGWTNSEWLNETNILNELAQSLITEASPKMEGFSFYDLSNEQIDNICELTPSSYLLQSKMAKPFVDAGINNSDITTVSSLTGPMDLMEYIILHEWNDGKNEAYATVMNTLSEKRTGLKSIKSDDAYDIATITYNHYQLNFYEDETKANKLVIIDINDGVVSITDGAGVDYLTNDVSSELNAVRTYAEYSLLVSALRESPIPLLQTYNVADKVAEMGSSLIYNG